MTAQTPRPALSITLLIVGLTLLGALVLVVVTDPAALKFVAARVTSPTPSTQPLRTFTDRKGYYQIQVPSSWRYEGSGGDHYYVDSFIAPGGGALAQNIAYDDGTPVVSSGQAQFALDLLGKYVRPGAATALITITDTSMMNDGSERLNWTAPAESISGITFIEIRQQTTFLIFTVEWRESEKAAYFNTLDSVVASYSAP